MSTNFFPMVFSPYKVILFELCSILNKYFFLYIIQTLIHNVFESISFRKFTFLWVIWYMFVGFWFVHDIDLCVLSYIWAHFFFFFFLGLEWKIRNWLIEQHIPFLGFFYAKVNSHIFRYLAGMFYLHLTRFVVYNMFKLKEVKLEP